MTFRLTALIIGITLLFTLSTDILAQEADIAGVNFYYPSNAYRPIVSNEMKTYLSDLKTYVDNNEDAIIKLDGYAQDGKNEEWNTRVSKYRVRAMRDILIDHGIKKSKIEIEYFGKTGFISKDDTDEEIAKNRRVELRLSGTES